MGDHSLQNLLKVNPHVSRISCPWKQSGIKDIYLESQMAVAEMAAHP